MKITWGGIVDLITILFFLIAIPVDASKNQYQHWFPQWSPQDTMIMRDNCSAEYQYYLHGHAPANFKAWLNDKVDNCILEHISETMKANMQSASVLLGLTPSILSLLGSSTAETSLLSLRRPFLALLLAAGSPSVNPIRSFSYHDPVRSMLQAQRSQSGRTRNASRAQGHGIVALELILALAAMANVAEISWRVGIQTICAFAAPQTFLLLVWTFAALLVHLGGSIALRLRVQASDKAEAQHSTLRQRIRRWIDRECLPCTFHEDVVLSWRPESRWFLLISWCTSTGTVIHIVFGTLVFSGIMFISTQDATSVLARFFGSALICRLVLMYELAGIREASNVTDGAEAGEGK